MAEQIDPSGTAATNSSGHYNENNEYINFDQFVMQHNLAATSSIPCQYYAAAPPLPSSMPAPFQMMPPPPPPQQMHYDYAALQPIDYAMYASAAVPPPMDMELVRNSNLIPTANEFVPMYHHPMANVDYVPPAMYHHHLPEQPPLLEYIPPIVNNNYDNELDAPAMMVLPMMMMMTAATASPPAAPTQVADKLLAAVDAPITVAPAAAPETLDKVVENNLVPSMSETSIGEHQGAIRKTNSGTTITRTADNRYQSRRSNGNNWTESDDVRISGTSGRNTGGGDWKQRYAPPQQQQHGGQHSQYENRRATTTTGGSGRMPSAQQQQQYERGVAYNNKQGFYNNNNRYDDHRHQSSGGSYNSSGGRNSYNSRYRDDDYDGSSSSSSRRYDHDDRLPINRRFDDGAADRSNRRHDSDGRRFDGGNDSYGRFDTDRSSAANRRAAGDSSGGGGHAAADRRFDKKTHRDFKPNRNLQPNTAAMSDENSSGACSQREKLMREIEAGRLECLVCCENIKPFQSCWSCSNCFHIIHLSCIIKWANSSKSDSGWRCPACQHVTEKTPDHYYCFCGKLKNPAYNRNDIAHSCGELCGKRDVCEHPCRLLCHPGPCPTCHASVTRVCGCGRSTKTMQCCQKDDLNCVEICDKPLNCAVHRCTAVCHSGPCVTCAEQLEHKCHCGKDKREVACTEETNQVTRYTCGKTCNGPLLCRLHKCKEICHPEKCGDCKLLPDAVTSCPCGRTPIVSGQRKVCTDAVPVCQNVCGKPLKCGQPNAPHQCQSKCHQGACPPCGRETAVKCRCGQMEQQVKCRQLLTRADDARCKKRCTKKRNCGKHKCNQECCIDIDHACPLPCNFNLSCGKHKCDQTCHKGRCQRCYRSSFVELYCECGANVIYPPVPCGSKKPACDRPCGRTHPCEHPVQHPCHSATACPPCMAFTTIYCYGKHEQRKTIPCSQGEFSCGLKCNRPLRCGQHKCIRTCHAGACETDKDVCRQLCTKQRVMCGHACAAPCHKDAACPAELPCREQVEVLCQCGNRKQMRTCQDFSTEYRRIASAKFASTMEDMQRGGTIELSDVLGPVKLNNNKTLDCNDECKVLERNRKLAICLQIRNPDLSSKLTPKYSEFIKGWAKKDPQLVTMIHDKLAELVKLAKQSQQRSRSHSFPTMNREKRQLVHEMCAMFGVQSVAYDAEPNRNVVANATKETSWLPSLSIMEVLQRENGQRRIPVPSNNAWGAKR